MPLWSLVLFAFLCLLCFVCLTFRSSFSRCFIDVGVMITSKYFDFLRRMFIKRFHNFFSQILSNYFFPIQYSALGHSGNLLEKNLNSFYQLIFLDSSHLYVVFITE